MVMARMEKKWKVLLIVLAAILLAAGKCTGQ